MEIKEDISYGVVPLLQKEGVWQVLLVHQISYRGDDFWVFPKGHAEEDESPYEAALRELEEETGITAVELLVEPVFTVAYSFIHEHTHINKQVEYRIGYCETDATRLTQPEEVKALQWCDFKTAQMLLTHQNSKDVLTNVQHFLQ